MRELNSKPVVTIFALIILFPLGYSVVRAVFSEGTQSVEDFIDRPDKKLGYCFRGTTPPAEVMERFDENEDGKLGEGEEEALRESRYMRFRHMDVLKDLRDKATRKGKRGELRLSCWDGSGTACSTCHPSRERFCDQCHNEVNLRLDCFGCHYYPEPEERARRLVLESNN